MAGFSYGRNMQKIRSKAGCFLAVLAVTTLLSGCGSNDYQVLQSKESSAESSMEEDGGDDHALVADTGDALDLNGGTGASSSGSDESDVTIVVYVCGAVNCSGVYELSEGSRIADAVEAAGGFSDEADSQYLNLAMIVSDGMKIQVPTVDEVRQLKESGDCDLTSGTLAGGEQGDQFVLNSDGEAVDTNKSVTTDSGNASDTSGLVNINTATVEELCTLSGIGESRANAIITYREQNGPFQSIEDIMKVSGIKDKVFEQIKDRITV